MAVDVVTEKEFRRFVERVNSLRCEALDSGEWFTDKSETEFPFFEQYISLIGAFGKKPSVTEYGGAVPVLSLYLLKKGIIDKIIVMDNDLDVLRQLDNVKDFLKLPVEVVLGDITKAQAFPDTDLGVSVNALYGYSPTPEQANNPPKLVCSVILEASHAGFALFRSLNNGIPWEEKDYALGEMQRKYSCADHKSWTHSANSSGYRNTWGTVRFLGSQRMNVGLHYITGHSPKVL